MWWPVVFWLLLIPLIIVETIIFLKTRKLFWLIYALSIFTYVVTVSYTLDVFDADRNVVIITLLASSGLMTLIGRQLGKSVKRRKAVSRGAMIAAYGIAILIIALFTVSVIFGKAVETVTPVGSIAKGDIIQVAEEIAKPMDSGSVTLLTRTYTNGFFLPVPIPSGTQFRACLDSSQGSFELYVNEYYEAYPEVSAFSSRSADVLFTPIYLTKEQLKTFTATEILVYKGVDQTQAYMPCDQIKDEPAYRIPVA